MTAAVVVIADAVHRRRSEILAQQLSLPLLDEVALLPPDCIAYLCYCDDKLQLFPARAQSGPITVDFAGNATAHRLRSGGELIVKAVRGRSKDALHVLDATAGLGRDSFILAAHNFRITAIEREPVIAALLGDGLQRARDDADEIIRDIAQLITLQCVDARDYLSGMTTSGDAEKNIDVVYLDPMFPHSDKSALVKKDMRLFQQLFATSDDEAMQLLACARAAARLRVVVKRPAKAAPLATVEPAYTIAGKAVRFDVYPS